MSLLAKPAPMSVSTARSAWSADRYHSAGESDARVYQVNPTYIDDSWAVHNVLPPDNPSATTGAIIPLETEWMPKCQGLPDKFQFGVWYDTSNANDVHLDVNREPLVSTGDVPLRRRGRDGAYISFEQQITGVSSKGGATLFLNITQADRETSASTDRQTTFGVRYKGPFTRPNDILGFAMGNYPRQQPRGRQRAPAR